MSKPLSGKRVAILATDGFEQSELIQPRDALSSAGAMIDVVSPSSGSIQGFEHFDRGETVRVDKSLDHADASAYDALVIPGGLFNPDALRTEEKALSFARAFFAAGKPVGAICHGPWVLIDAGVLRGRQVTSVESIRQDLLNAGAHWADAEVVVDNGLVTSRTPKDLPSFCEKLIEEISEGRHRAQNRASQA
jgi:protease I